MLSFHLFALPQLCVGLFNFAPIACYGFTMCLPVLGFYLFTRFQYLRAGLLHFVCVAISVCWEFVNAFAKCSDIVLRILFWIIL